MNALLVIFMIVWLISSVGLTITILMHSGKGTGLSEHLLGHLGLLDRREEP